MKTKTTLLILGLFISITVQFLNAQDSKEILDCYKQYKPIKTLSHDLNAEQAEALKKSFIAALKKEKGKIIGYKAGLTSKNAQRVFGADKPVWGVLYEKMLLKSGAHINPKEGVRLLYEADLLVKVRDEKINDAKTLQEILQNLESVIPFIEVPDLMYEANLKLTAPALSAINVGARWGVLGTEIPLSTEADWAARLLNFQVEIGAEDDEKKDSGDGKALLGNPLEVVLWLKYVLNQNGYKLKKGDVLSLGSITPLRPVVAGKTIKAVYTGLTEDPIEVIVSF